jgi:hypothetical protein
MTDHRMDGWARRLARSTEDDLVVARSRPSGGEAILDRAARALAAPVTRRRAVGLIGGVMLAGSLLRPGRGWAQSGCSGGLKECRAQGGQRVCVPENLQCCNNDKCAIACPYPWRACEGPGVCQDTAALCGRYGTPPRTKYCERNIPVTGSTTCGQPETVMRRRGWCCRPGETCGPEFDECTCPSSQDCGDYCCTPREVCVNPTLGSRYCDTPCPGTGKPKCGGTCCTRSERCGVFGCDCPSGTARSGGDCVSPRDDPGDPRPSDNPFRNMFDMLGQVSSSHGGSSRLMLGRRAQTGASALDAALDALAAVNAQGAAAMLAFRFGRRDPAFRRRVAVKRAKPPTLAAGPGLDAASATALNNLLVAEARANALIAAAATALWRARTARVRRNRAAARSQMRASARFAGQAAAALRRLPPLRTAAANALRAGGATEVAASEEAVAALVASVRRSGLPSYLTRPLGRLGASAADIRRLRSEVPKHSVVSASGPILLKPLDDTDRARTRQVLVNELAAFSRRARRHRLAR